MAEKPELTHITQEQLDQVLSVISGGIAVYRFDNGKIKTLYFSDGLAAISGYTKEEYARLIKDDALNMVIPEDRDRMVEIVKSTVTTASDCNELFRVYHKTNSSILVSVNAKMTGFENDSPVFHVIFMKMSEESRLYYDIANFATNSIYVIERKTHEVLYINRELEHLFRQAGATDVLGKKCYNAFMGDEEPCPGCPVLSGTTDGKTHEIYNKKLGKYLSVVSHATKWNGQDTIVVYANDITGIKQTNEEIQQIYNGIPGAVFRCRFDKDWTVLFANDGLFSFLGYTRKEFAALGNKMSAVIYPDDLSVMTGKIMAQLETGKTQVENENRLICKDGTVKWISIKAQLLKDPAGEQFFYCVFVDITRQKEEEQQLKIVEKNLEIAIQHAEMLYWEYDIKSASIFFNKTAQEWFDLPKMLGNYPESFLGLGFVEQNYTGAFRNAVQQIQDGSSYIEFEARIRAQKHNFEWMRLRFSGIKDENGQQVRAICTGEIIAEYKHLETCFMTTLQQNNISNWTYDIRRHTIILNPQSRYLFQHDENNEIANVPESQIQEGICHPDDIDVMRRLYRRIDSGERQVEEQLRFIDSRTKEFRWKKCIYTAVEDNRGIPIYAIGSALDITDQLEQKRKYESALEYRKHTQVDNLLLSGHCNITNNTILELIDVTGANVQQRFGRTRESLFLGLESLLTDETKQKEFHALFTNDAVKRNFARGMSEAELSCEINLDPETNRRLWVTVHIDIIKVPETNDIEGFLTVVDKTAVRMQEHILNAVVECDYDYLASINLTTNTITFVRKNTQERQLEQYHSGTEYPYGDFIQDSLNMRVAAQDRQYLKTHTAPDAIRAALEKSSVYEFTYRMQGSSNRTRVARVRYISFDKLSDTVVFTRTDVTEMVQEEERKHQELQEALTQAIRSNLIINTVTNQDYDYVMVVNIAQNTYELNASPTDDSLAMIPKTGNYNEQIKSYAETYVHPEDIKIAYDEMRTGYLQEMLKNKDIYISQVRLVNKDGSFNHKRCKISYLDNEHTHLLITRMDITDIIENEEQKRNELTTALALAKQAAQAKSDFLSRMSHDLRTPMNIIIGLTALTIDDAHNPDLVRANMGKLRSTGNFMLRLINDILDMAKIENGAVELHPELYEYNEFIMIMKTMFTSQCEQKGLKLTFQELSFNPVVCVDKTRLNQIFFNVLSNSIKYTQPGGTISYEVKNMEINDRTLSYDAIITDTGIGMSEEFQRHMFDPFTQEDTRATPELQGTGLGLSITKQLVEMMGGSIHIASKKNEGTAVTLHFTFEFVTINSNGAEKETEPEKTDDRILNGKNILLAEDHPLNAQIARRLLEKKGIYVISAENGADAVGKFSASTVGFFDAILMDIRMPEMDGYMASRTIRAMQRPDARSIPIIAMTANAYPADVTKSQEAGMNSHLAKPIDPALLYRTLETIFTDR